MSGIGSHLEFPCLLAVYSQLSSYPLYPANTYPMTSDLSTQFRGDIGGGILNAALTKVCHQPLLFTHLPSSQNALKYI
jgi:hypothetical protein